MSRSLEDEFVQLLEDARGAALTAAADRGIPLVDDIEIETVMFEGNGWSCAKTTASRTVMADDVHGQRIGAAAKDATAVARNTLAATIIGAHPPERIPGGLFSEATFGEDPVALVADYLLTQAQRDYLKQLPSLAEGDLQLASAFANALERALANKFTVHTSATLGGFSTLGELEAGALTLRQLTPAESGRFLPGWFSRRFVDDEPYIPRVWHEPPRHLLRSVVETDWEGVRVGLRRSGVPEVVLAMQLLGYGVTGVGFYNEAVWPRWLVGMSRGMPFQVADDIGAANDTGRDQMTAEDFAAAVELSAAIPVEVNWHPTTTESFALRRFGSGCTRRDNADALLDFVVALESTLVHGGQGETSFRFATFGAAFLEQAGPERLATFRELRGLYDIRSRVVHGGRFPDPRAIEEATKKARSLASRVLAEALRRGWPARTTLTESLLSGG